MIRLQNVNFATNKADILPDSYGTLDIVGQVLRKWPELRIEVGGHTDARGSDTHNQRLSEARAKLGEEADHVEAIRLIERRAGVEIRG